MNFIQSISFGLEEERGENVTFELINYFPFQNLKIILPDLNNLYIVFDLTRDPMSLPAKM